MRHTILTFFFLILVTLNLFSDSPESPVDLQNEPHHHLKFENQYVRVWDTLIPAKTSTLWHRHSHNNVVLTLGDADVRVETVGAEPAETHPKLGDVGFRKAEYVHRTMSIGATEFHNMAIEILTTKAVSDKPADPTTGGPVVDNEQVRVYRISLAPGESIKIPASGAPAILIAMTSGEIELIGSKSEREKIVATDVRWHAEPVTQSIKNVGKTQFWAVQIEIKK